jgi:hypothetical protein
MLDKIPSLKDFIIYFIPGTLMCYFGLNIITILSVNSISLTTDKISNNSVLIFIGVLFSFLVGFVFSQLQIICFNYFLNKNDSEIRKIKATSMSDLLKLKTAESVMRIFELSNVDINAILNDSKILHLCLNYVKFKGNEETNIFLDRSSNLSSFASASTMPIFLGIWNFALLFTIPTVCLFTMLFVVLILVIAFNFKITLNFRKEWINSVYKQFLIQSK